MKITDIEDRISKIQRISIEGIISEMKGNASYSFNEQEEEFQFYKRTDLGLTTIIINDEHIAHSFIPYDVNSENELTFYYKPFDYKKLASILD